jgi:hypothetical protein
MFPQARDFSRGLLTKMGADTDGGINKEAGSKSKQDKKQ